jgi:hypothetical protein
MTDLMAIQHRDDLNRGKYHKSMYMDWRKCNLAGVLYATGLVPDPPDSTKRLWLTAGNKMHDTADELHDDADPNVMAKLFHYDQVYNYLLSLIDKALYPRFYHEYINQVVKIESDRWVKCMRYSLKGKRMLDWKVAFRELYIDDGHPSMALNVDRIERVPGTVNSYALIEWKRLVRIEDIRQELSWYFTGIVPWVIKHNQYAKKKFGFMEQEKLAPYLINLTHWGAYGYHPDSEMLYEKINKVSINAFNNNFPRFIKDMTFGRNYKGTIENLPAIYKGIMGKPIKKLMGPELKNRHVALLCGFCKNYRYCYTKKNLLPILFKQHEVDDGVLHPSDLKLMEEYQK